MKVTVGLALAGLAAAAPLRSGKFVEGTPEGHRPGSYVPGWSPAGLQARDALHSGKFVEGTPEGHQPGSYVPGVTREPLGNLGLTKREAHYDQLAHKNIDKRIGPTGAAVLGGVVSGTVSVAAMRWANRMFGTQKKRAAAAPYQMKRSDEPVDDIDFSSLTWDEARAAFANGVTADVFDDAEDGEAAVCVSVPYSIDDPAATRDATSIRLSADGQQIEYDCFLLAAGATVSVDAADVTDGNVAVRGGEFKSGVLTV